MNTSFFNKKIKCYNRETLALLVILGVIFLFYTTSSVFVTNVTIMEGIKYIAFQVLGVYCIGMFVSNLLGLHAITSIQMISINYAIGYAVQILNWYFSMIIGNGRIALKIYVIEFIILAYFFFKKSDSEIFEHDSINTVILGFLVLCVFSFIGLRFFMIGGYNILPHGNAANNFFIHDDFTWEIMQTVATKYSFPVDDLRWMGDKLCYHYWGYACNGVMSNVTGISCAKIITSLSYINEGIFFVISVIAFLQFITERQREWCFGVAMLLFTTGIEWYSVVTWSGHLTTIPLFVDIGIAYMLLSIGIVLFSDKNKLLHWKYLLVLSIFMSMSTGSKGPCAMIALVVIIILCCFRFTENKKWSIKYALCASCSFGLVYAFVDSGIIYKNVNGVVEHVTMITGFLEPMNKYPLSDILQVTCDYPSFLSKLLLLVRYLFYSSPAIFVTVVVLFTIISVTKIKLNIYHYTLLAGYLMGYLFACIVNQDGCSEMYFTFSALPFGVGLIVSLFSEINTNRIGRFPIIIIILAMTFGITCEYTSVKTVFMKGYHNIAHNEHDECNIRSMRTYRRNIYEACVWLKDNSTYNDIVVTNTVIDDIFSGFEVTAFAERRQWLEYPKYTRGHNAEIETKKNRLIDYYENKNDEFLDELYKEGVRYLVNVKGLLYSKDLNEDSQVDIVFENEEVQIGRISVN